MARNSGNGSMTRTIVNFFMVAPLAEAVQAVEIAAAIVATRGQLPTPRARRRPAADTLVGGPALIVGAYGGEPAAPAAVATADKSKRVRRTRAQIAAAAADTPKRRRRSRRGNAIASADLPAQPDPSTIPELPPQLPAED